jgi:hypothetical protein
MRVVLLKRYLGFVDGVVTGCIRYEIKKKRKDC